MAEHERSDKDVYRPPIFVTVVGTILGLSTVFVIIGLMVWLGQPAPPPPREDERPRLTLEEVRAAEHQALTTYTWIDRERGIVRIPIEAAMERLVQEGRPPRPAAPAPQPQEAEPAGQPEETIQE
jgi:hypothetical protein